MIITRLVEEAAEARARLDRTLRKVGSPDDPAVVHARKTFEDLQQRLDRIDRVLVDVVETYPTMFDFSGGPVDFVSSSQSATSSKGKPENAGSRHDDEPTVEADVTRAKDRAAWRLGCSIRDMSRKPPLMWKSRTSKERNLDSRPIRADGTRSRELENTRPNREGRRTRNREVNKVKESRGRTRNREVNKVKENGGARRTRNRGVIKTKPVSVKTARNRKINKVESSVDSTISREANKVKNRFVPSELSKERARIRETRASNNRQIRNGTKAQISGTRAKDNRPIRSGTKAQVSGTLAKDNRHRTAGAAQKVMRTKALDRAMETLQS